MPTKIEWTDETWNVLTGCSVLSAGCKNCYAQHLAGTRLRDHPSRAGLTRKTATGHVWTGEVRFNPDWLRQPLQWTRPREIFVCAHADIGHDAVKHEWLVAIWAVMEAAPRHTFQILTKRPLSLAAFLHSVYHEAIVQTEIVLAIEAVLPGPKGKAAAKVFLDRVRSGAPAPHIHIGVSAENQEAADERVPILLGMNAGVMWVSYEPALGPVDWTRISPCVGSHIAQGFMIDALAGKVVTATGHPVCDAQGRLDWIEAGGESDMAQCRKARPSHPGWYRETRDQCAEAGVAFGFKQWGCYRPVLADGEALDFDAINPATDIWFAHEGRVAAGPGPNVSLLRRAPKAENGRELDGVIHDGKPGQ